MIKGRKTRNAGRSCAAISVKPCLNDISSPKRKESRSVKLKNSACVDVPPNRAHRPNLRDPVNLRGSRSLNVNISDFLKISECSRSTVTGDEVVEINIPCENTSAPFTSVQSSIYHDVPKSVVDSGKIRDVKAVAESRKTNNLGDHNNIFLQEPVLSLYFNQTSPHPTRGQKKTHKPVFVKKHLKSSLFSSEKQPQIDTLWKNSSIIFSKSNHDKEQSEAPIKHSVQHALDLSKPTQVTLIDSTTAMFDNCLHYDHSNSCDSVESGENTLSKQDGCTSSLPNRSAKEDDTKRKKPTTPHRILGPSPKTHPIVCSGYPIDFVKSSILQNNVLKKTNKRFNFKDADNISGTDAPKSRISIFQQCQLEGNETKVNSLNGGQGTILCNNLIGENRIDVGPSNVKATAGNKKITEFYPVRRSVRKTKKEVQVEKDRDIEHAIQEQREEGLKIQFFDGKGRGIVTTRPFLKGEFVVEYIGDLISVSEAKRREQIYAKDDNTGCYMYYFKHKNLQHCIDATAESGKMGRLVNHSRNGNLVTKTVSMNNRPHLVLIAKEDIEQGVEVTYDYGDRSKEALQHYPWLAL